MPWFPVRPGERNGDLQMVDGEPVPVVNAPTGLSQLTRCKGPHYMLH